MTASAVTTGAGNGEGLVGRQLVGCQIEADGETGRFCPVIGAGFVEDIPHVVGDGIEADKQVSGNLSVAFAGGYQAKNLHFSLAQARRVNGGRSRRSKQ